MTDIEFRDKIDGLKDSLHNIVKEYIETNKQYNVGDILKVSFVKNGRQYVNTCKIVNIYLRSESTFMASTYWPTPNIVYFARYCCKNLIGEIQMGNHCSLGKLNGSSTVCGHSGIDEDTLKIEVIEESEL